MPDENPRESTVWGDPDPASSAQLSKEQAEAQAKIDAIRGDPNSPFNRGDQRAAEEVLGLYRVLYPSDQPSPHMESGSFTAFRTIGKQPAPTLTAAQAQAEIDRINADKADPFWKGDQAAYERMLQLMNLVAGRPADDTPPDPNAPPATPGEAFIASASDLGMSKTEAEGWVQWAEAQPSGGTLQQVLVHWPEDVHGEVTELAKLAWDNLDLKFSARATAEQRGLQYGERAFRALVKRGLEIRDKQEAEALKLAEERPGDARLHDPARRHR